MGGFIPVMKSRMKSLHFEIMTNDLQSPVSHLGYITRKRADHWSTEACFRNCSEISQQEPQSCHWTAAFSIQPELGLYALTRRVWQQGLFQLLNPLWMQGQTHFHEKFLQNINMKEFAVDFTVVNTIYYFSAPSVNCTWADSAACAPKSGVSSSMKC